MPPEHSLYLVTAGYEYYPAAGAHDWKHVSADEATARAAFEREAATEQWAYLILVNSNGWTVLEERWRDA